MKKIDYVLIGLVILLCSFSYFLVNKIISATERQTKDPSVGLAGVGVVAQVATSSAIQIGPQVAVTLFAENEVCSSRVISTVAQPAMISFSNDVTPNGITGHLQAASTTVAYDSGIYGCETVKAFGFASTTITKTEFR